MPDFSVLGWVALVCGAVLAGFSKTAIAGVTTISIALYAAVMPARQSTGTLLLLLICGDIVAVLIYRRAAAWGMLARLAPPVLLGILAGAWFLDHVSNTTMRRVLGIILLVLSLIQLGRMVRARRTARTARTARAASAAGPTGAAGPSGAAGVSGVAGAPGAASSPPPVLATVPAHHKGPARQALTLAYGMVAGFTTMVANAGGPVMNLYLLAQRFDKLKFLGTTAWFFFGVNLIKVPFSLGLHLITPTTVRTDLVLVPAVLVGCVVGRWCIKRINQRTFELLVLGFTALTCIYLLV